MKKNRRRTANKDHREYWGAKIKSAEGTITPLVLGFFVLGMSIIITVTNATSLYLEKKRLLSIADGSSLIAAEGFSYKQVSYSGSTLRQVLVKNELGKAIRVYLHQRGEREKLGDIRLEEFYSDGRGSRVRLSSQWVPPLIGFLFPDGFRIEASSYARGRFMSPE